jgi:Ca-activated chloride channel homolog
VVVSLPDCHLAFASPPLLAVLPLLVLLAVLGARRGATTRAITWSTAWWAPWRRGILVAAVGLALAGPVLVSGGELPLVVLVDRSPSVAPGAADKALAALNLSVPGVAIMPFGDEGGSPLAAALDMALRALPGGGRIAVLTDGRATGPDPVAVAARAAATDVRVDGLLLPARAGPDAAITALDIPSAWRAGGDLPVTVSVRATAAMSATLTVSADGAVVTSAPVALAAGLTTLRTQYHARRQGDVLFRAEVRAAGDALAGNDVAYGTSHLAPPARLLVVGDGIDPVTLADLLTAQGFEADVMAPPRLPSRLSALAAWDAMVLVDVPATAMGFDQLAGIQAFASDLGRGVVLTAGRQSFLAGVWEHTPLADLAPVRLEPPERGQRDAVALLMLIDQSASMGGEGDTPAITKLDLAREAAILATEVLHPGDEVGVIAYDAEPRWLVPLTKVGDGRELATVEEAIAGLVTGGGTRILRAMELGLPALADVGAPTRHAVLLSDGRDFNPDEAAYRAAVGTARGAGITLSTIAIGYDADQELLQRLATWGQGRYYLAENPADLPRLAAQESEIVRARSEQVGSFRPVPAAAGRHPVIAGVDVTSLPALGGYVAVGRREGAEVALETPTGDPLLATWNYGLGRVAAWMSDAGEVWATDWPQSPAAQAFWSRLVRYVARAPESGPPGVTVNAMDGRADVAVEVWDQSGRAVDGADVTLVVTGTGGVATYAVPQEAPGRYQLQVAAGSPGAYPAVVARGDGADRRAVPAGWVVDYPAELRPGEDGRAILAAVTQGGGGRLLAQAPLDVPRGPPQRRELWPLLLALALMLWVLEVARELRMVH